MSDSPPPRVASPRAVVAPTPTGTGMISPATPFVAPDGTLAPVSFRFLYQLFTEIADIEKRLATAGIP